MPKKKTKRKSRSIIIGHLERISSKVFDQYRKQITDIIKGNYGVYALYRRDKLYYIGLATDFHRRIPQHLKDRHKGRWNYFSLYIIRKSDHIREIETLLLCIANPSGNVQKGKLKGSRNLGPKLKRLMTEDFKKFMEVTFGDTIKKTSIKKGATSKSKSRSASGIMPKEKRPLLGYFPKGKMIYANYKGQQFKAWISYHARIRFEGRYYDTPSAAGAAVRNGKSTDGWHFWKYKDKNGELQKLSTLRK